MSAAITKASGSSFALAPTTFDEVYRFADMAAKSDLVPRDFKGKPGNIMIAIQMGAELGLAPMQSLQGIAVVNGRPSVWGDALLALVQAHPECEDVQETCDGKLAKCIVKRRGRSPVERTFSVEDAKLANLWGKQGPWSQYPKRMLQMRARAFALRDSFADVLRGLHVAEEAQDIPTQTKVTVREPSGQRPSSPPPALPPHDAATGEVLDAEIDPFDYVITFGKNNGKALRDLPNTSLHWYAEEYKGADRQLPIYARAVIDARKKEREIEQEAQAAAQAKLEQNDGWGLGLDGDNRTEQERAEDHAHHEEHDE